MTVTAEHLANRFKDAILPPVLATPIMIMMMENAALNAIKPYLDANESALGTRVDVRHLAATPAGRSVTANAEVTKVDGRHIEFRVDAKDGTEEIGAGVHERMIIDLAKFLQRLAQRAAKFCTIWRQPRFRRVLHPPHRIAAVTSRFHSTGVRATVARAHLHKRSD